MSRPVSRRALLGAGVATGLGVVVAGSIGTLFNGREIRARTGGMMTTGYGPLVTDPEGRLALPEGFRYRVLAEEGVTRLESGELSPSDPDGAAVFARPDGSGCVLICNHEVGSDEPHPVPHLEGLVYDPSGRGGTTTMEIAADGSLVRQYVSLAGTVDNCAGGRTPWDTWLSCEETEGVLERPHGYVFEVDPFDPAANRDPRPIKALGRFAHEAVVVDPEEHVLYLTEDARRPNGLLYRWTPPPEALPLGKGSLRALADDAGTLAALRATTSSGRLVQDLAEATEIGTTYQVDWVEVPERDAMTASIRRQFTGDEITRGHKLEGAWWGDGGAYVVSSYDRPRRQKPKTHDGQVWFLDPRAGTLRLHLRFAPTNDSDNRPDGPDNITVSPYGGVLIAEDGNGDGRPHLLGATPEGGVFYLAQSGEKGNGSEFCGPVFSPDEQMLFVNQQGPGTTFLVQGPFRRLTR